MKIKTNQTPKIQAHQLTLHKNIKFLFKKETEKPTHRPHFITYQRPPNKPFRKPPPLMTVTTSLRFDLLSLSLSFVGLLFNFILYIHITQFELRSLLLSNLVVFLWCPQSEVLGTCFSQPSRPYLLIYFVWF